MAGNEKVYEMVTDKVISALEAGTVPWHKPWSGTAAGLPRSISTGKAYRGINPLLLSLEAQVKGYASTWWGTYDAIAERCGMVKTTVRGRTRWVSPEGDDSPRGVRKGEKSTMVVFWKRIPREDTDPVTGKVKTKYIFMLRYFNVFNAEQADGINEKYLVQPVAGIDFDPIAEAEAIVAGYANGPTIRHTPGDGAWYQPAADLVNLPVPESFTSGEHYYSTAFHELTHSTGHASRLNREGVTQFHRFGDENYSKEELVAEMGAAFLSAVAGIDGEAIQNNSAAYIANWLTALKGDKKLIVQAAAQAQKAADRILGTVFAQDAQEPSTAVSEATQPALVGTGVGA